MGELRELQAAIQTRILKRVASGLPTYVLGGVPGRSIRDNGRIHSRKAVLVTMDLRGCFSSITNDHVYAAFAKGLCYGRDVASTLTRLTTLNGSIPQGAPTSTMVANLALLPLHRTLNTLASRRGLSFSAWVDDLAFSGPEAEDAIEEAMAAIHQFGFAVSRKKTRVMRGWRQPQQITGTTVNRVVSAGRSRVTDIEREILQVARRERITESDLRSIYGKIRFVAQLRPSQARRLESLATRVLPRTGCDGRAPVRVETRKCQSPSARHDC